LKKSLEALIELQEVDCNLQRLEQAKGDLPQKVNSLKQEVEDLEKETSEKKEKLAELEKKMKSNVGEVALLEEKLAKYQKQLYNVKTNKEYDALTLEIDTAKEIKEQLEFESLEIEEEVASLAEEISSLEQKTDEMKQELKERQAELNVMLDKNRHEEEGLLSRRQKLIERLPVPIVKTYDRIRVNRGGRALALLKDGSCSECSSKIPPQRALEIRMMDHFFTCEVCGRILVWRPDADTVCKTTTKESAEVE